MPQKGDTIRTTSQTLNHRLSVQSSKVYRRTFRRLLKKSRKRMVRYGLLTANFALLFGVVMLVIHNSASGDTVQANNSAFINNETAANPLDQVSSADIAVNVARMTNLAETTAVTNHADSFNTQLTVPKNDDKVVAKPQVVATAAAKSRKDIQKYVAKDGDTISSIAAKFGVTSDSVKWTNGMTGDSVSVGKELTIPPVNGIVYTVKTGDTADNLAQKYNANKDLIIAINDAEITGLKVNSQIIIPDAVQPVAKIVAITPSFGATPPTGSNVANGFAFGGAAIYGYNGYDFGWCTWWAAKRRADIGEPVPANLGDAYTWASRAASAGFGVGGTPAQGAVIMSKTAAPGHVGFVEQINSDGSAWVSDMNSHGFAAMDETSGSAGGWNRVSYRRVSPEQFGSFKFIY